MQDKDWLDVREECGEKRAPDFAGALAAYSESRLNTGLSTYVGLSAVVSSEPRPTVYCSSSPVTCPSSSVCAL